MITQLLILLCWECWLDFLSALLSVTDSYKRYLTSHTLLRQSQRPAGRASVSSSKSRRSIYHWYTVTGRAGAHSPDPPVSVSPLTVLWAPFHLCVCYVGEMRSICQVMLVFSVLDACDNTRGEGVLESVLLQVGCLILLYEICLASFWYIYFFFLWKIGIDFSTDQYMSLYNYSSHFTQG